MQNGHKTKKRGINFLHAEHQRKSVAKYTHRILLVDDSIECALHIAVRAQRFSDNTHQFYETDNTFDFTPDVPP
jgi:hypothetical protein